MCTALDFGQRFFVNTGMVRHQNAERVNYELSPDGEQVYDPRLSLTLVYPYNSAAQTERPALWPPARRRVMGDIRHS